MNSYSMVRLPWGGEISFYVFWLVFGALISAVWTVYRADRHGVGGFGAALFTVMAGALALVLGRAVYCGVRYERLFFDPRGEFIGLSPYLDLTQGGISVIGVLLGVLLAAALAGAITRNSGLRLLDCAAVPGLMLFACARFIEPMNGSGFGDLITNEAFCRFPFAIENGFGDFSLSVSFIEAVLAALIGLFMLVFDRFCKRKGTLAGVSMALLCVSQIMPESLRLDDMLFLFIFARVTQMGYGVLLLSTLVAGLIRGRKRGLSGKSIALEIFLLLLGVGVVIGAEFALDKTNWPHNAVYAGMIAALLGMGILVVHRLAKEDRGPHAAPAQEDDPEDEEAEVENVEGKRKA